MTLSFSAASNRVQTMEFIKAMLLLILIAGVVGRPYSSFSIEQITNAAYKCCTLKREQCCHNMIKSGLPVGCGYKKSANAADHVYRCLQNELHSEPEQRMPLDDAVCCQVFGRNATEANKACEVTCKETMSAPSIESRVRLERIERCHHVENPLFKCFQQCLNMRREGVKIEVLRFDEYCS